MAMTSKVSAEDIRDLLETLDEAALRDFAIAIQDDQKSRTTLYSIYYAIYVCTKADDDLEIVIDRAEQLLSVTSEADETWAQLAEETSNLLKTRFQRKLVGEDLDRALHWIQEATRVTSDDSACFGPRMSSLADLLNMKDDSLHASTNNEDLSLLEILHKIRIPAPGTDGMCT
jgi:galactokinase